MKERNIMNKDTFTPFGTHGLILTDTHGNEFTIENDTQEISIYGQWQGLANSPTFQQLVEALKAISDNLAIYKDKKGQISETAQFKISKKKEEVSIDFDLHITKDGDSLIIIQAVLAKIQAIQLKTNKP